MDINLLIQPHHREEVDITHNDNEYFEMTYDEWVEVVEKVEDGDLSYATWYQDGVDTKVLCHYYKISNGKVVSYEDELID